MAGLGWGAVSGGAGWGTVSTCLPLPGAQSVGDSDPAKGQGGSITLTARAAQRGRRQG